MTEIVITKPLFYLKRAEEILRTAADVVYPPDIERETIARACAHAKAVIVTRGVEFDRRLIASSPDLQVIAVPTAGFDNVDVAAATEAAIPVIANNAVAPDPVVEFTLGLVISLVRRIHDADRALRAEHSWSVRQRFSDARFSIGDDLGALTYGIIGVGQIGARLAGLLRSRFNARVIGLDPMLSLSRARELDIEVESDPVRLAHEVDVLLVHAPLTASTRHLVSAEVIRALKPTAYLVNCARGGLVDEAALVEALRSRQLAGAALDVFEDEPLAPGNPLLDLDNTVLTPHIAGVTRQSDELRAEQVARRVLGALDGVRPEGLVNPDAWEPYLQRLTESENRK